MLTGPETLSKPRGGEQQSWEEAKDEFRSQTHQICPTSSHSSKTTGQQCCVLQYPFGE